jgi:hypothetical protein
VQDMLIFLALSALIMILAVRDARHMRRIKALESALFQALGRAARLDESARIMGDKLKQIAKERANE